MKVISPHPGPVGSIGEEAPLDEIRSGCGGMVVFSNDPEAPLAFRFDAGLPSQSGHPVLAARDSLAIERSPGLYRPVGLEVREVHRPDLREQLRIGKTARAGTAIAPFVIAAARNAQHPTQRCDGKACLVYSNERVPHGSSFAKYAAAFFKISRSSVTCFNSGHALGSGLAFCLPHLPALRRIDGVRRHRKPIHSTNRRLIKIPIHLIWLSSSIASTTLDTSVRGTFDCGEGGWRAMVSLFYCDPSMS